jgi:hypothetical protein
VSKMRRQSHTMLILTAWLMLAGAGGHAQAQDASMPAGNSETSVASQWSGGAGTFKVGAQGSTWGADGKSAGSYGGVKWGAATGSVGAQPGGIWRDSYAPPGAGGVQGPETGIGSTSGISNTFVPANVTGLHTKNSFLAESKRATQSASIRGARPVVKRQVGSRRTTARTASHRVLVRGSASRNSVTLTAGTNRSSTSINRSPLRGTSQGNGGLDTGTGTGEKVSGLITPLH